MALTKNSIQDHIRQKVGTAFSNGIQNLGKEIVSQWIIRPGMEFASPLIWWGDVSKTRLDSYGGGPHEGLDFALARKVESGQIQANLEGLRVPTLLDGNAIWRFDDLVGDTLIVASDCSYQGHRFIVQYSHIDFENAQIGDTLSQGHDIGKIKRSLNPKSITASHLHISTALIEESLLALPDESVTFENWLEWDKNGSLIYFDPLSLVDSKVKEKCFLVGDAALSPISRLVSTGASKDDRIALRRTLARNFPGIQSISVKTPSDAKNLLRPKSLLISSQEESWKIEYTDALDVPSQVKLFGDDSNELVATISKLEQVNF